MRHYVQYGVFYLHFPVSKLGIKVMHWITKESFSSADNQPTLPHSVQTKRMEQLIHLLVSSLQKLQRKFDTWPLQCRYISAWWMVYTTHRIHEYCCLWRLYGGRKMKNAGRAWKERSCERWRPTAHEQGAGDAWRRSSECTFILYKTVDRGYYLPGLSFKGCFRLLRSFTLLGLLLTNRYML